MFKLKKKQWILLGIMLVLSFALTAFARVPANISYHVGNGEADAGVYATLGDVSIYAAVLLCGWPWGAIVAAVGAAVADIVVGSKLYVIGTMIVKAVMAYIVALLALQCTSWKRCFAVAIVTELIMIVGYFIFTLLIVREFVVAGRAFLIDLAQGVVCAGLGGVVLHYLPVVRPGTLPKMKSARRPAPSGRRERDDEWS